MSFEPIMLPGGGAGNNVRQMTQDAYGFLWLASQYGLHRYDGYRTKTFLHNPLDQSTISSSYVTCVLFASDKSLWVGTADKGLNQFSYESETFRHFSTVETDRHSLSNNNIVTMVQDRQGMLWIGTNHGLNRLNPKTGKVERFLYQPNDSYSLCCNQISSLYIDSEGVLWVGTGMENGLATCSGLYRFEASTKRFIPIPLQNGQAGRQPVGSINAITEDRLGRLWIGETDLWVSDKSKTSFALLSPWHEDMANKGISYITSLWVDERNHLLIGTSGHGLINYCPDQMSLTYYDDNTLKTNGFNEKSISSIYQTQEGVIWISTNQLQGRVYKRAPLQQLFQGYHFAIREDVVQAFCENQRGDIWLATQLQSLARITAGAGPVTSRPAYFIPNSNGWFTNITHAIADTNDVLWMAKAWKKNGLLRYDPKTNQFTQMKHQAAHTNSLSTDIITDLVIDNAQNIWIATSGGGLNRYNQQLGAFTHFRKLGTGERLSTDYIDKLHIDEAGYLWMAGLSCEKGSLYVLFDRFNSRLNRITHYKWEFDSQVQLARIMDIREDQNGKIWICLDKGLLQLDPATSAFTFYEASYFGSGNQLKGMEIDDDDQLWILADQLVAFNPYKQTIFTYGTEAGIDILPFYQDAIHKLHSGGIVVGGRGGYLYFYPEELKNTGSKNLAVRVTGIETVRPAGDIPDPGQALVALWGKQPFRVGPRDYLFTLYFAAMDFQQPKTIRHEYMLEGFDKRWRVADYPPKATYVHVPAGNYAFRVRAAGPNGRWSEEAGVSVTVVPPWWKKWWAYLLFGAVVISAIAYHINLQFKLHIEKVKSAKKQEIAMFKARLHTNISQEFRIPLTIMLEMVQKMKQEPQVWLQEGLELIARHAKNLLDLISNNPEPYQQTNTSDIGVDCLESNSRPPFLESEDPFVKKVRQVIESHLDDPAFGVEELCHEMNLSHSQCHRKLAALTGISAVKFIRDVRLDKAKYLLLQPEYSIIAVALDTGFNDPSYFGRIFKQEFGMTPVEWREKMMAKHPAQ